MEHMHIIGILWEYIGVAAAIFLTGTQFLDAGFMTSSVWIHIHERALRIAYRGTESSFDELLAKDNSVSVHQRNLQLLMIEIYKTKNSLNPSFTEDVFVEKPNIPYVLRNNDGLLVPRANTTAHGIETIQYVGSRL